MINKNTLEKKIKSILDNLDSVCSNKLKAQVIVDELEKVELADYSSLPFVTRTISYSIN